MKTTFFSPLSLNKLLLIILFCGFVNYSNAQNCTTPDATLEEMQQLPWFANPNYLPTFMDSLRRVSLIRTSRVEDDIIWRKVSTTVTSPHPQKINSFNYQVQQG